MGVATIERWERAHPPISGLDYFETWRHLYQLFCSFTIVAMFKRLNNDTITAVIPICLNTVSRYSLSVRPTVVSWSRMSSGPPFKRLKQTTLLFGRNKRKSCAGTVRLPTVPYFPGRPVSWPHCPAYRPRSSRDAKCLVFRPWTNGIEIVQ